MDTTEMNEHLKKSLDLKTKTTNQEASPVKQSKKAQGKRDDDKASQSSSIMAMQHKLLEIASPSSSKPDDDSYDHEMEENQLLDEEQTISCSDSAASIPMAHREYEKIMRQLEAECRTHIKCEQQMKLHIECLQEKLDNTEKDRDTLRLDLDTKLNSL